MDNEIKPFSHPQYQTRSANVEAKGFEPCAVCGKKVNPGGAEVEVLDGGGRFARPGEECPHTMGFFWVGSDCAKRLRKAGYAVQTFPTVTP
jgi:hypothetical protein